MRNVAKEQLFFIITALIIGYCFYDRISSPYASQTPRSGKKVDAVTVDPVTRSPDAIAGGAGWAAAGREVFAEPRDWSPLPPADLSLPPMREPSTVSPFPSPSMGLAHVGGYRAQFTADSYDFSATAAETDPGLDTDQNPVTDTASTEGGLTSADEEYRQRYDWLELKATRAPWYGIIHNEDKYSLDERPEEPIEFQKVDPETQRLIIRNPIAREQLRPGGIHLADNVVNRVEIWIRDIPERDWTAGTIPQLLEHAERMLAEGEKDPYAHARAEQELEKYLEVDPGEAQVYELLADSRLAQQDYEGELEALLLAENKNLRSGGLNQRRARWLWRTGARRRALEVLEQGIRDFPTHVGLRLECGLAYLEQGEGEAALKHFEMIESAATDREQRIDANRRMGEALLAVGKIADARVRADRILGVSAEEPGGLRLMAACQFAAGEFSEAADNYRKLLEVSDSPWTESDALLGLGLCLARAGEFGESERRLSRVLDVNPLVGGNAHAAEAYLQARGGRSDTALDEARAAVRASPDDPYLHYVLGRLLRVGNDFEEAEKELKTALNQASFSDLYNELAYLGLLDGRASDAVNYARESLAREDREETRILLGHSLIEAGSMIEARRLFEGAMQRKPNPDAQLGLAFCMYRNRESGAAQQMFQQLADSFPDASDEAKSYAASSLAAIVDVESKVQWQEFIHWRQVGNGWLLTEPHGINPRITSGSFRLMGNQKPGTTDNQLTFLERPIMLDTFFEFELDLQAQTGNQGRYGVFLAHIVGGGRGANQASVRAAIYLAVEPDGKIVFKKGHSVQELAEPWKEVEGAEKVLPGQSLSLGLKRRAQGSNKFQLLVDGIPTGEDVEMDRWRGTNKTTLAAAFFVAADGGRKVDVAMTEARIVKFTQ